MVEQLRLLSFFEVAEEQFEGDAAIGCEAFDFLHEDGEGEELDVGLGCAEGDWQSVGWEMVEGMYEISDILDEEVFDA